MTYSGLWPRSPTCLADFGMAWSPNHRTRQANCELGYECDHEDHLRTLTFTDLRQIRTVSFIILHQTSDGFGEITRWLKIQFRWRFPRCSGGLQGSAARSTRLDSLQRGCSTHQVPKDKVLKTQVLNFVPEAHGFGAESLEEGCAFTSSSRRRWGVVFHVPCSLPGYWKSSLVMGTNGVLGIPLLKKKQLVLYQ